MWGSSRDGYDDKTQTEVIKRRTMSKSKQSKIRKIVLVEIRCERRTEPSRINGGFISDSETSAGQTNFYIN